MYRTFAEVDGLYVQTGNLGEAGVEVYGDVAVGVESDMNVLQPQLVEYGHIVGLIVAPVSLEPNYDPFGLLTPAFGRQ